MKIKDGFKLRNICNTNVIIAQGVKNIEFNKIINLNDSAAWLWTQVEGREFTHLDIVSLLTSHYEVDNETADRDSKELIDAWLNAGIIEE